MSEKKKNQKPIDESNASAKNFSLNKFKTPKKPKKI